MTSQQLPAVRRGAEDVHREEVCPTFDQGDGDQVPDDLLQVRDQEHDEGQAHPDAEASGRSSAQVDKAEEGTRAIIDTHIKACFMPFFKAFLFYVFFLF